MIDIIVEIFLEIYMELMLLISHNDAPTKKQRFIAKLIAIIVLLGVFALIIYGAILLFDYGNKFGLFYIILAVVISLAQITAGIILYFKKHRN